MTIREEVIETLRRIADHPGLQPTTMTHLLIAVEMIQNGDDHGRFEELKACQQMVARETLLRHPVIPAETQGWLQCARMIYMNIQNRINEMANGEPPMTDKPFTED